MPISVSCEVVASLPDDIHQETKAPAQWFRDDKIMQNVFVVLTLPCYSKLQTCEEVPIFLEQRKSVLLLRYAS